MYKEIKIITDKAINYMVNLFSTNSTAKAINYAKTQVGVKESGKNRGVEVEKYLKSVGLGGGFAWCVAFVHYCFQQANKINPFPKTAGVHDAWNKLKANRISEPENNCLFFIDTGGGFGHMGFVLSVDGDTLTTIEGNTNSGGSRDGEGVYLRTRKKSTINLGYVKL